MATVPNDTADVLYNWVVSQAGNILSGKTGTFIGESTPGTQDPGTTDPSETNRGNPGATTNPPSSTDFPWSSVPQNNPAYPYALWGGEDNFKAQKPPDWMVKMVDDALALPSGAERSARILHILSTTTGMPDYLKGYLHSRLDQPAMG